MRARPSVSAPGRRGAGRSWGSLHDTRGDGPAQGDAPRPPWPCWVQPGAEAWAAVPSQKRPLDSLCPGQLVATLRGRHAHFCGTQALVQKAVRPRAGRWGGGGLSRGGVAALQGGWAGTASQAALRPRSSNPAQRGLPGPPRGKSAGWSPGRWLLGPPEASAWGGRSLCTGTAGTPVRGKARLWLQTVTSVWAGQASRPRP